MNQERAPRRRGALVLLGIVAAYFALFFLPGWLVVVIIAGLILYEFKESP